MSRKYCIAKLDDNGNPIEVSREFICPDPFLDDCEVCPELKPVDPSPIDSQENEFRRSTEDFISTLRQANTYLDDRLFELLYEIGLRGVNLNTLWVLVNIDPLITTRETTDKKKKERGNNINGALRQILNLKPLPRGSLENPVVKKYFEERDQERGQKTKTYNDKINEELADLQQRLERLIPRYLNQKDREEGLEKHPIESIREENRRELDGLLRHKRIIALVDLLNEAYGKLSTAYLKTAELLKLTFPSFYEKLTWTKIKGIYEYHKNPVTKLQ